MRDSDRLSEQARLCCSPTKIVIDPELVYQLRMWSVELADEADTVERNAAEREQTIMSL